MWPYKSPTGQAIPRKAISVPEPLWRQIRDNAAAQGVTITRYLHELVNPKDSRQ